MWYCGPLLRLGNGYEPAPPGFLLLICLRIFFLPFISSEIFSIACFVSLRIICRNFEYCPVDHCVCLQGFQHSFINVNLISCSFFSQFCEYNFLIFYTLKSYIWRVCRNFCIKKIFIIYPVVEDERNYIEKYSIFNFFNQSFIACKK